MVESNKNGVTQDYSAEMQKFASTYKEVPDLALGMLGDTAKDRFEKHLPDGFGVAPRVSEDGTILSIGLVQKN